MTTKSKKSNTNKGIQKTYGKPTPVKRKRAGRVSRSSRRICSEVCAQVDPFCPLANGSKIADGSARNTVAFQSKQFVSLGTNASGFAAIWVPAHPNLAYSTASTFTGTAVTAWNTNVTIPDYTNLAAVYSKFRVVSYGVRVFCEANPTESKGYVTIATIDEKSVGTLDLNGTTYTEYERLALSGLDASWTSKRIGAETSVWNAFADTTEHNTTTLFVGVGGATASTAVLCVEITMNFEFIPEPGNAVAHLATPAPPVAPVVSTAVQHVQTRMPSTHVGTIQSRSKNIWDVADSVIKGIETYGPMALAMLG